MTERQETLEAFISKPTTILVSFETRQLLRELGHKGDTYDEILKRLMERCEE